MADVPTREEIEKLAGKPLPDVMWAWIVEHGREQDAVNVIKSDKET